MHYSYEFKLMCVELYLSGSYPDIPEGGFFYEKSVKKP